MEPTADVDRAARDVLAEMILAAARGNEPPDGYALRPPLFESNDYGVQALLFVPDLIFFDLLHDRRGSAETWRWVHRVVALLRSDLRLTRVERTRRNPHLPIALAAIVALLVGGAASVIIDALWPFILAWIVAGLGMALYLDGRESSDDEELERLGRFAPFRTEEQWNRYRHLVAPDELPPPPEEPIPAPAKSRLLRVLLYATAMPILLPGMLLRVRDAIELVDDAEA